MVRIALLALFLGSGCLDFSPYERSDGGLVDSALAIDATVAPDLRGMRALPTVVQLVSNYNFSTSYVATFPDDNTQGNAIIVYAERNSLGPLTVSDSQGNTYQSRAELANADGSGVQLFYAQDILGGPNAITITSKGNGTGAAIHEYAGLLRTGSMLDGVAQQSAPSATAAGVTPPVTTTEDGELLFAAFSNTTTTGTILAGTGWSPRASNMNYYMASQDRIATTAGAYAATATLPRADTHWNAILAAFRAAR